MEPDLEPDYESTSNYPGPRAGWLSGFTWAVLLLSCLGAMLTGGFGAIIPLMFAVIVAWVSAGIHLVLGVWLLATGRGRLALPYFFGFLPLALLCLCIGGGPRIEKFW